MRRSQTMVIFIILVLAVFPTVYADRGMIPVTPGVSVYEPGQKAILAWNGREEILILSTDVTADQETMVLEILPLPSEPRVEAASFQAFTTIQEMIWEEGVNRYIYSNEETARGSSVQILFHEQIGAHNITVASATESLDLLELANNFISSSGLSQQITLQNFQSTIDDYMNRGFRHFVLDLITFSPQERSIDPILYGFNSSTLYYPLLITSPVGGNGKITLFTLTHEKVEGGYWPLNYGYYQTSGQPWQPIQFTLSRGDLSKIDLRISELLPDGAWLSALTFTGNLASLTQDMMIAEEDFSHDAGSPVNVAVYLPQDIIALCFLLGTASALAGVAVAVLISRAVRKK